MFCTEPGEMALFRFIFPLEVASESTLKSFIPFKPQKNFLRRIALKSHISLRFSLSSWRTYGDRTLLRLPFTLGGIRFSHLRDSHHPCLHLGVWQARNPSHPSTWTEGQAITFAEAHGRPKLHLSARQFTNATIFCTWETAVPQAPGPGFGGSTQRRRLRKSHP